VCKIAALKVARGRGAPHGAAKLARRKGASHVEIQLSQRDKPGPTGPYRKQGSLEKKLSGRFLDVCARENARGRQKNHRQKKKNVIFLGAGGCSDLQLKSGACLHCGKKKTEGEQGIKIEILKAPKDLTNGIPGASLRKSRTEGLRISEWGPG